MYAAKSLYTLANTPVADPMTTAARVGLLSGGSNRVAMSGNPSQVFIITSFCLAVAVVAIEGVEDLEE